MTVTVPIRVRTTEPADSPVRALREILSGVPGKITRSRCGCVWKRVTGHRDRGVVVSGDLLIRRCSWHEWYAALPDEQKRRLAPQRAAVRSEGRTACRSRPGRLS